MTARGDFPDFEIMPHGKDGALVRCRFCSKCPDLSEFNYYPAVEAWFEEKKRRPSENGV